VAVADDNRFGVGAVEPISVASEDLCFRDGGAAVVKEDRGVLAVRNDRIADGHLGTVPPVQDAQGAARRAAAHHREFALLARINCAAFTPLKCALFECGRAGTFEGDAIGEIV